MEVDIWIIWNIDGTNYYLQKQSDIWNTKVYISDKNGDLTQVQLFNVIHV